MFRLLPLGLLLTPLLAVALQAPPGLPEKVETTIKLRVVPARPPKPALKHQLLPEAKELQPGNPIQGYMRCFAHQNEYFQSKEVNENQQKWLGLPLDELPDEVRAHIEGGPLKLLDTAARLDTPDWAMVAIIRRDG